MTVEKGAYAPSHGIPTWLLLAGWGLSLVNLSSAAERPLWWALLGLASYTWLSFALVKQYRHEHQITFRVTPHNSEWATRSCSASGTR